MSKGNVLLGMARGAVGDIVFSRLKGQQVTRARNRQPANPRTSSQMYQRALFTDAVKFFTRGRRNLFQFAFENKKENESDYNAFMRENAKRGVVISKAAFDNYGYPALGNWIMSKGTLVPLNATMVAVSGDMGATIDIPVTTELTAVTTVADLSSLIVDGVDFLQGDIITIVNVASDPTEVPNVDGVVQMDTEWKINQLQLTNSTQPLADFGISATITTIENVKTLRIRATSSFSDQLAVAGTAIHSRNTQNGVRVSTQEIVLSTIAQTNIDAARQRSYIDAVVESWRITQQAPVVSEAVMQGSIAQSIAVDFSE